MNLQMMVTYIGVDFFCILMAITMGISIQSDFGSEFEVTSMRRALTAYIGFLVFGLIWMLTQTHYLPYHSAIAWISNSLSLLSMTLASYYWFFFAMARIRRTDKRPGRLVYFLCQIPMGLAVVLCLTTPMTGWVFKIAADGTYYRGKLYVFVSSLQYLYSLVVCIYAVRYGVREKNKERRILCWLFGLFLLFPLVAGIVQMIVGATPIQAPAIITSLFIIFVYVQRTQIYNDALTGLNNRKRLFSMLETKILQADKEHPMILYLLDANRFKQINDQYGHAEGDKALIAIAECIMQLAGEFQIFVARYGGDEFMMLDYGAELAEPAKVTERLHTLIQQKSKEKKLSYPLAVSIGYTLADDPEEKPEVLIARADQMLYEEKAKLVYDEELCRDIQTVK